VLLSGRFLGRFGRNAECADEASEGTVCQLNDYVMAEGATGDPAADESGDTETRAKYQHRALTLDQSIRFRARHSR
jgi:hypothetical protein